MNRRGFFGLLAASAAVVVAPELAELLVPKRTIFLPPVGGWVRGNSLLSAKMISEEALRIFTVQAEFIADINREYDSLFTSWDRATFNTSTIKVGDRIMIAGVYKS